MIKNINLKLLNIYISYFRVNYCYLYNKIYFEIRIQMINHYLYLIININLKFLCR